MQGSKGCFKCKEIKPLSEFYKHRMMKDGHLNKCIDCTKLDVNKHRKDNLEAIREYDKKRSKLPHRIVLSTYIVRNSRKRITGYSMAHNAVARAIKSGKLKKTPCAFCQSIMVHAHHDDYTQPLNVMWLCPVHHKARHSFLAFLEYHKLKTGREA